MTAALTFDEALRVARHALQAGAETPIGRHVTAALVAELDRREAAQLEGMRLRGLDEISRSPSGTARPPAGG
jgi:hypothetical protein